MLKKHILFHISLHLAFEKLQLFKYFPKWCLHRWKNISGFFPKKTIYHRRASQSASQPAASAVCCRSEEKIRENAQKVLQWTMSWRMLDYGVVLVRRMYIRYTMARGAHTSERMTNRFIKRPFRQSRQRIVY